MKKHSNKPDDGPKLDSVYQQGDARVYVLADGIRLGVITDQHRGVDARSVVRWATHLDPALDEIDIDPHTIVVLRHEREHEGA